MRSCGYSRTSSRRPNALKRSDRISPAPRVWPGTSSAPFATSSRRCLQRPSRRKLWINSFNALSVASTSASTGMIAMVSSTSLRSPRLQADVEGAKSRLQQTLERFPLTEQAQSSMRRLGLDRRGGSRRAPPELLAQARGALELPGFQEGGPASVLIPLRERIEAAIAELLRRRPTQEPAGKAREKLTSLGRQCRRDGLDEAYFERRAVEADPLLNDLSGAKQGDMPRERVNELFHRGLLFLNSLLDGMD